MVKVVSNQLANNTQLDNIFKLVSDFQKRPITCSKEYLY